MNGITCLTIAYAFIAVYGAILLAKEYISDRQKAKKRKENHARQ